jgi:hypothetical protein
MSLETKNRIKTIIKEVDDRNYDESIREDKWKEYWEGHPLVSEMFELVDSLMTEEEQESFSNYCLKATNVEMIDYIQKNLLKEK